jgi:uncharacterized membrane protein
MKKTWIIGIIAVLALFIAGCSSNNGTGNAVAGSSDNVKIPLSDLSSQVKFYEHDANGATIRYFAVLGSDGQPRTAFDACDVCGGYKGYVQQGSDIACRNCGRVFSIDGLGTKNKGYGCWPSYLPHEIKGDNVIIKISDIENGRHRFA